MERNGSKKNGKGRRISQTPNCGGGGWMRMGDVGKLDLCSSPTFRM